MFLAAGGKTIVDTAPCSLGRDIRKLLEVNAQVDAHIIASTGFQEGMLYDNVVHWVARYTVEQIAELLVADIEEGIDIHDYMGPIVERSTARAGAIKIGTGYGMISPFEAKIIHAAALAQRATGAVLNTHTRGGTMALEQAQTADALRRPARAHHARATCSATRTCGTTRRSRPWASASCMTAAIASSTTPTARRVELIRGMIKAGYQKQITLGCDAGKKSYQKAYGAGTGFDYDLTVFVPRLREEGIPEDAIEDMLVNNPARLFALEK